MKCNLKIEKKNVFFIDIIYSMFHSSKEEIDGNLDDNVCNLGVLSITLPLQ